jgi:hypothetical protein
VQVKAIFYNSYRIPLNFVKIVFQNFDLSTAPEVLFDAFLCLNEKLIPLIQY